MKNPIALWLVAGMVMLLLAGCGTSPKNGAGAEVSDQSTGSLYSRTPGDSSATTSAASQGEVWQGDPLLNPNSLLATRVIYFEFDESSINMDYRDVLSAHAEYLVNNAQVTVRLEGHADERGTREYNLGLGERRANSVRSLLMAEGVLDSQIVMVSYGEERPAAYEHNEDAWALNRRVELLY
jgi:peptidoglycan-associated lipoprotein